MTWLLQLGMKTEERQRRGSRGVRALMGIRGDGDVWSGKKKEKKRIGRVASGRNFWPPHLPPHQANTNILRLW